MNDYSKDDLASITLFLRAISDGSRLRILHWLADPVRHFPAQVDGDLVQDGVCVGFITDKIGLRQPTVTSHMRVLRAAGLVRSRKIKNWVFYRLEAEVLAARLDQVAAMTRPLPPSDPDLLPQA